MARSSRRPPDLAEVLETLGETCAAHGELGTLEPVHALVVHYRAARRVLEQVAPNALIAIEAAAWHSLKTEGGGR